MFFCHSFVHIETKHQLPIALNVSVCALITFMISERERLSSIADAVMIIFQKETLNGISVGDIEKN